jgi:hypothetical protein
MNNGHDAVGFFAMVLQQMILDDQSQRLTERQKLRKALQALLSCTTETEPPSEAEPLPEAPMSASPREAVDPLARLRGVQGRPVWSDS